MVVKTDSEPLQASNTLCSSETYSPHFYKPPTHLPVSKQTLQTSTSSYTLCIRKKGLSEPLQASNMLWSSQSTISKLLQAGFEVVKTNSPMPPTCFEFVKTDSPKFYKPPAHFAVVKRTLRTSRSHPPLCVSQNGLSDLLQVSNTFLE